jgi:hypothetical protein
MSKVKITSTGLAQIAKEIPESQGNYPELTLK